jgi:cytochrome c oxidase subunit III
MPRVKKAPEEESGIVARFLKLHPVSTAIRFLLGGITVLFLTLMVLFALYNPGEHLSGQPYPKWFFFSTALILLSSYTVDRARRAFLKDDGTVLLNFLLITLVLGTAFSITQFLGWQQLWNAKLTLYGVPDSPRATTSALRTTPGAAFLFIISGLHVLHLTGGLIYLFISMFRVVNHRSDQVKSLLFFSSPLERARISSLAVYWHFLDFLWVLLFLYFLWFFV